MYVKTHKRKRERERERERQHSRRGKEEESANKLSSRINPQRRLDRPGQAGNKFLREPNRSTWICSALINRNLENEAVENRVTVSSLSMKLTRQFRSSKKDIFERKIHRLMH